jgi:hypothetical protein
MNHLTQFYKNRAEMLQEQINRLNFLLLEVAEKETREDEADRNAPYPGDEPTREDEADRKAPPSKVETEEEPDKSTWYDNPEDLKKSTSTKDELIKDIQDKILRNQKELNDPKITPQEKKILQTELDNLQKQLKSIGGSMPSSSPASTPSAPSTPGTAPTTPKMTTSNPLAAKVSSSGSKNLTPSEVKSTIAKFASSGGAEIDPGKETPASIGLQAKQAGKLFGYYTLK